MRRLLLLLLLGASTLLVAILAEPGASRRSWSPFSLVCLSVYVVFLAALALSVACYRKHTARIQNAWLALLTSGLSLVALDVTAHHLKDTSQYARTLPDPVVHHRLWPETTTRLQSEDFVATLEVNRDGLRGKEPAVPKQKGTFRLIMLGDSFTMGEGVSDEQAFPAVLERSLAARMPVRVEVVNAGVDSYSPILSYLDLRENLLRLEPELVLVLPEEFVELLRLCSDLRLPLLRTF